MRGYFATDVAGNTLPVKLVSQYPRKVITGLCWSWIGTVKVRTPHAEITQVLFFDKDGTQFWATDASVNEFITRIDPSYMLTPLAQHLKESLRY